MTSRRRRDAGARRAGRERPAVPQPRREPGAARAARGQEAQAVAVPRPTPVPGVEADVQAEVPTHLETGAQAEVPVGVETGAQSAQAQGVEPGGQTESPALGAGTNGQTAPPVPVTHPDRETEPPAADAPAVPDWVRALTTARVSAGASLEQVSARTRVRAGVLRDLESGQLTSSGGTVYARGHLRSVAQALGVDPAVLLAPFDAELGAPPAVPDPEHLPVARAGGLHLPVPPKERAAPRWGAALVAALAVLAGLLVVGSLRSGEPGPVAADPVAASPTAAPARPRASTKPAPPRPVAGARLRLRVLEGSSWVRVSDPRGTVFEGVLAAGQAPRDFADGQQLTVLAGNAGALGVACAGRDLAPAGSVGAVRRFTCGPKGLAPA